MLFFQKYGVNITGIKDLRQEQSRLQTTRVEYKRNFIVFQSTTEQETKLKRKLQATGLAVDLDSKPFKREDLPIVEKSKSSSNEGDSSVQGDKAQKLTINDHSANEDTGQNEVALVIVENDEGIDEKGANPSSETTEEGSKV